MSPATSATAARAPAQDLFVARQPIFDLKLNVAGYELLFRNSTHNAFPNINGDRASAQTIHDALNVFGLDVLSNHRPLYFNVTREVLLSGLIQLLPPRLTTVEILESVEPTPEVVAACRILKKAGFTIALDDFIFRPGFEPLVEVADIIKVDFLQTRGDERSAVIARHARPKRRFLAEKIESAEEQADAVRCGYTLFQGFFFSRPQMLSVREVPTAKVNYLRLLQLVSDPSLDIGKLQDVIKHDVSLSVKLLRYLNSAMFGWYQKVTSIQQALVLLGANPFRKWVAVLAAAGLGENLPPELVVTSLVRARFCEQLRPGTCASASELELFLLGMLSLLDVMTGRPMPEMLAQLAVSERLRSGLLERAGSLGLLLRAVEAFEQADWLRLSSLARSLGVGEEAISTAYHEAVGWADGVFAS